VLLRHVTPRGRRLLTRLLAVGVATSLLVAVSSFAGAATPRSSGTKETAANKRPPIYQFLIKSGFSKRAKPEAAVLKAVVTLERGGQKVVTSTVKLLARREQPETLNAIQAAIVNGTLTEAKQTPKVGSIEISYNDGKVLSVVIYEAYYEITTSAGILRFTSKPLGEILWNLLK